LIEAPYRRHTLGVDLIDGKDPKTPYKQLYALYDNELVALGANTQPQPHGHETKRVMRSQDAPLEQGTVEAQL
jgi:hypothetical protein